MSDNIKINELQDALKVGTVNVTFTKVDGTSRVMRCTLKEGTFTPPQKKTDAVKPVSDTTISVWDLDNSGWRSFRKDSVTAFEVLQ